MKKKNLFEEAPQTGQLKVNQKFAEKFTKRKEREHIDKMKARYGDDIDQEDQSDSSIEDENGDLINEKVTEKFFDTIAKIRFKHPKIYETENVFEEDDFVVVPKTKEEKMTYRNLKKQQLLEGIADSQEEDEDEQQAEPKDMVPEEEERALKEAFKKAAQASLPSDGLLIKKEKTQKQIDDEKLAVQQLIKRNPKPKDEIDVLKRYWVKEETLDEKDKFLRKFILSKGWVDKDDLPDDQISDSSIEEKADEFEEKINFRFEQPGGNQITTYQRNIGDTVRQEGNEKRKEARKNKELRKEQEKQSMQNEIEVLRKAKKAQLLERLEKLKEVSGVGIEKTSNILDSMREEYDEKKFDQQMEQLFDEEYYDQEDSQLEQLEEDINAYYQADGQSSQKPKKQQKPGVQLNEAIQNAVEVRPQLPVLLKRNLNDDELKAIKSEEINIWWYCDECQTAIQSKQFRWDCQKCDDYTLCKNCFDAGFHKETGHKLKRLLVPESCQPPDQEDVDQILQTFKVCSTCKAKLTEFNDYYQYEELVRCVDCFQREKIDNRKKFQKVEAKAVDVEEMLDKNPLALKKKIDDKEIQKLVDEYYDLDFEDVIAGGIKTKYKYMEVEADDFGLDDDDLLYCDDDLLNKYLSVKKIHPYRTEPVKLKMGKFKGLLQLIKKTTKKNKKLVMREQRRIDEIEEQIKNTKDQSTKEALKEQSKAMRQVAKLQPKKRVKQNLQEAAPVEEEEEDSPVEDLPQKKPKLNKDRLQSYGIK